MLEKNVLPGSPRIVYSQVDTKTITMSFVYVKEPGTVSLSMAISLNWAN